MIRANRGVGKNLRYLVIHYRENALTLNPSTCTYILGMKILVFNGSAEPGPQSTSNRVTEYFRRACAERGAEVAVLDLAEAGIPLLDLQGGTPGPVERMVEMFREADRQIWLAPLYHGGIPGVMKNCLDWLEVSSGYAPPYLTDKVVGMVCWADGGQAMQGINAMDAVAKALRAWTLPYSIPVIQSLLYSDDSGQFSDFYRPRFELFTDLITRGDQPGHS